jgi:hypothetical protein
LWTVLSTREYPPAQLQAFDPLPAESPSTSTEGAARSGLLWILAGVAGALLIRHYRLQQETYLLAGGLMAYGVALLWLGGAGLLSFLLIRDPHWLLASMLGVGFAWASILSLPYAMLSDSLPAARTGVYMGIFNFFIVIPQLVAASVLGELLKRFFHGQPMWALVLGGASLVLAGLCALRVRIDLR